MPEKPRSSLTWLLAAFLGAQLGLLWLHGALLHRQQAQLTQIHEDLQDLADAMDSQNNGDAGDQGDGNDWAPAGHHMRSRAHGRYARARRQEAQGEDKPKEKGDEMDQATKDIEDTKKSNQDAVAKARQRQSQLSIEENYKKGQQQREVQEAQYEWTRWVWLALIVLAAAFGIRAYVKRNA